LLRIDWRQFRAAGPIVVAVLTALLTGCTRFTDTVSLPPGHQEYALYGSRTIGQTFVCYHAGLNGIGVLLKAGTGDLVLHLREDAESASDIATVAISPPPGDVAVYHQFDVPLQDDVNGASFFLLLEAPGATAEAPFVVYYDPSLSSQYSFSLDGSDLTPGHLSFQLHYSSLHIVKDVVRQAFSFGLEALRLLFLSALFYLLPGGAVVVWLLREGDWIERVIVALGMSVAVYALLMYATMTGLRLGRAATIAFLVLCSVLIGVRWWLDWRRDRPRISSARDIWASMRRDPSPVALAFVFALVLGVRIFVVRDLVAPMWGDGYHHTMISQLLVDNGGLFDSWEPYAPLTTFTYHFGFHANVALFHWLSGDSVIHSVIWIGQILNALAVLALYPLALKVSEGNRWAGVGAVLVAGLLSPMPMSYVNWGRYTQLAGQVILPVLVSTSWHVLNASRREWRLVVLNWVMICGLALTHYRVLVFYVVFVLAWLALSLRRGRWRGSLVRVLWLGIGSAALFTPWLLRAWGGGIARLVERQLTTAPSRLAAYTQDYNAIGDLSSFLSPMGWLLLVAAVAVGLWQRRRGMLVVSLWWFLLLITSNPAWVHLPGSGVVSNFALFIAVYVPFSVSIADSTRLVQALGSRRRLALLLMLVFAVALGVLGARVQIDNVGIAQHALVTGSDLQAMEWIAENAPEDARFLVNSFFAYGERAVVGSDAGWWLPLLAARSNTVPPLNYRTEAGRWPGYGEWVEEENRRLHDVDLADAASGALLSELEVTHIYIGRQRGRVNYDGPDVLDPDMLLESACCRPIYHYDGVWVFEVVQ
jgi:hypothetical protein